MLKKQHVIKDFYGYHQGSIYFSAFTKNGLGVDLWKVSIDKKSHKKIISDGNYHNFQINTLWALFTKEERKCYLKKYLG